jgi:hypothetical protein
MLILGLWDVLICVVIGSLSPGASPVMADTGSMFFLGILMEVGQPSPQSAHLHSGMFSPTAPASVAAPSGIGIL